jgi:ankyrin repeat protein
MIARAAVLLVTLTLLLLVPRLLRTELGLPNEKEIQTRKLIDALNSGSRAEELDAIRRGADVNATFGDLRQTALMEAAAHNSLGLVRALIGANANVNAKDRYQRSVLWWAERGNNPEILRLLRERGAMD